MAKEKSNKRQPEAAEAKVEGASKKSKKSSAEESEKKTDLPIRVSKIATPLADRKLTKKVLKLIKKAHADKKVYRGIKDVCKAIRKGNVGVCFLAGNISPDDVITHMPVLCEEASIPYCFVPSKEELGVALGTKRSTCVVLVSPGGQSNPKEFSFKEEFDGVVEGIEELD